MTDRLKRELRDFPRVLLFTLGAGMVVGALGAVVNGNLTPVQIWAEAACLVLGLLLIGAWREFGR